MENEFDFGARIWDFLKAKGYPDRSIVAEFPISDERGRAAADFAIVDPVRQEVLALLETKRVGANALLGSVAAQLDRYARSVSRLHVPAYLIAPRDPLVEVLRVFALIEGPSFEEISPDEFPTFEALRAGVAAGRKEQIQKERGTAADTLKMYCGLIAAVTSVLLLADIVLGFSNLRLLTAERISLIAIIAALVVIPYAAKLKILGIEFERYVEGPRPEKHKRARRP